MGNVFLYAVLFACAMLAVGLVLRLRLGILRALYIPASVVAGVVGFALLQVAIWASDRTRAIARPIFDQLGEWPAWLIAVVFAALLLERPSGKGFGESLKRGARSGILAYIIILGQIVAGLLVYLVMVRRAHPDVPASFGQLLEVSWAGGHGASTAMGDVYRSLGFSEGRDLALFLATIGLIYGVLSGLVIVNVAIRRGWTSRTRDSVSGSIPVAALDPPPIAFARPPAGVIRRMMLQCLILAAAFGAGYLLQQLFVAGTERILGADDPKVRGETVEFALKIPLFLFTLLGGLIVREVMHLLRIGHLIDSASMQRLVGIAMAFLIVSAIASVRVEALSTFLAPVAVLAVLAAAWCAFCLLVLAPRLLPRAYWFELGLLNYGFSTANTPQGMMLLRIVDPDLKTGATEDYAIAAPLSAPFVGGGVVTIVGLPVILQHVGAAWVAVTLTGMIVVLYVAGRALARD